ncbi:MAG: sigma-54-dependent Fis family transcriptional regulator, partial [Gallionellales bacterium CG_4_10_14_3_um_filter_54_96]
MSDKQRNKIFREGQASQYGVKAGRVLLVDDEPDILELLEMALLKMGLSVDKAVNLHTALDKL